MSRGEGDNVAWGMWGLVVIAGILQLFNFAFLIATLATIFGTYNENK